ncbi:MAG TPA: hypothetical protein VH306_01925 [Gaiellaceae bacterium]
MVGTILLVPLVGGTALAVPPRAVQRIAAPLWEALRSPLAVDKLPADVRVADEEEQAALGEPSGGDTYLSFDRDATLGAFRAGALAARPDEPRNEDSLVLASDDSDFPVAATDDPGSRDTDGSGQVEPSRPGAHESAGGGAGASDPGSHPGGQQDPPAAGGDDGTVESPPSDPGDTSPPDPGDSTPPDPGDSAPPDPGDTTPPDPGDTTPPDPGDTTPPDPGDTTPPDPGDTAPPDPGDTTPPDPGDTTPPDPGDTTPPDPGDTDPGGSSPPDISWCYGHWWTPICIWWFGSHKPTTGSSSGEHATAAGSVAVVRSRGSRRRQIRRRERRSA